jgi:hypothetical protein
MVSVKRPGLNRRSQAVRDTRGTPVGDRLCGSHDVTFLRRRRNAWASRAYRLGAAWLFQRSSSRRVVDGRVVCYRRPREPHAARRQEGRGLLSSAAAVAAAPMKQSRRARRGPALAARKYASALRGSDAQIQERDLDNATGRMEPARRRSAAGTAAGWLWSTAAGRRLWSAAAGRWLWSAPARRRLWAAAAGGASPRDAPGISVSVAGARRNR